VGSSMSKIICRSSPFHVAVRFRCSASVPHDIPEPPPQVNPPPVEKRSPWVRVSGPRTGHTSPKPLPTAPLELKTNSRSNYQEHHHGLWGFWAEPSGGGFPVPKMKNGRSPIHRKNHTWVLGLWGGGSLGKTPNSQMKNGRNPNQKKSHWARGILGGVYGGDHRFPK